MAPNLGKRKRRAQVAEADVINVQPRNDEVATVLQARLRQHFEEAFEPLEVDQPPPANLSIGEGEMSSDNDDDDWDGLSENDEEATQIIHQSKLGSLKVDVPQEELKTFMSSKPPSSIIKSAPTAKRKQTDLTDPDDANNDAANLKKDLALQRLLKESHLLEPQSSLSHSGQNRHKALDLRLQDMGSKSSIFKQENMPLAQRKGIIAKAADREGSRRRNAQENGIILEKAIKGNGKDESKRQRGIGAPSVGRFQGGMLKLSKKDVADIEGPKRTLKGRK